MADQEIGKITVSEDEDGKADNETPYSLCI